jgi:hypothetical protein
MSTAVLAMRIEALQDNFLEGIFKLTKNRAHPRRKI